MPNPWQIATWIIISLLLGGTIGIFLGSFLFAPASAQQLQLYFGHFLTSPGVGGIGAVTAACIAYIAATKTLRVNRDKMAAERKERTVAQWWDNARWATDMLLSVRRPGPHTVDRPPGWDLLTDPDAKSAITALSYLSRSAPTTELNVFVTEVMAAALEVSGSEKSDKSTPAPPERPSGRRFPWSRTPKTNRRAERRTTGATAPRAR